MRVLVASTLIVALLSTSCAPALSRSAALVPPAATGEGVGQTNTAATLREAARRIPKDTTVTVNTLAGETIEGTLVEARESAMLIKTVETRDGKQFTATASVPYDRIRSFELKALSKADAIARDIPLGAKIEVMTTSGEVHRGRLRSVGEATIVIEEAQTLEMPYDRIASIGRDDGMRWYWKAAIIWVVSAITLGVIMSQVLKD